MATKSKPYPREIAEKLISQFGESPVQEALECEVQDAKELEASMISDDGPESQIEYLITEACYDAKRIIEIVEQFCKERED